MTHPRCAGRIDLRCPFGCRTHHRKQRSNQRSAAYYRTPSGKWLKKQLNAGRSGDGQVAAGKVATAADEKPALAVDRRTDQPSDEPSSQAELRLEDLVLSESTLRTSPMLPYVVMIVGLLESMRLRRHELLKLLLQSLRQHSIAYRTRTDYVLRFLHQHPP